MLTGLTPLVLAVVLLALGEVAVRVIDWMKYGAGANVTASAAFYKDAATGLRLPRPGVKLGKVQINSAGFRGPDVSIPVPVHTLRIAFVGSSTTYDASSSEDQQWPAQTTQYIASQLPRGCAVDFVNGGLPGFTTAEMTRLFQAKVAQLAPAIVVILPGDVTIDIQGDLRKQGIDALAGIRPSWLAKRLRVWEKIEKNVSVIRLSRTAHDPRGKIPFDHARHAAAFRERLERLVDLVESAGAVPALVTITGRIRREQSRDDQVKAAATQLFYNQFTTIPDLLDARDAYNGTINTLAKDTGTVLIAGEGEIPADAHHFSDSMHFAPAGSARMGHRVGRVLLESRLIDERIKRLGGACARWRSAP